MLKRIVKLAAAMLVVNVMFAVPPTHATTVCFDLLSGRKCVDFRTPPPVSPRNSRGTTIQMSAERIISGESITATAKKFKAGEYVRAFVFNVYGRAAATELSGGAIANKKGVATVSYGTTSLPISVKEERTICLRGEQSGLMSCASFIFEG